MTVRDQILAAIEAAIVYLAVEVEVEPAGDPSAFPALGITDAGHAVLEREVSLTRRAMTVTIDGFVDGAGGNRKAPAAPSSPGMRLARPVHRGDRRGRCDRGRRQHPHAARRLPCRVARRARHDPAADRRYEIQQPRGLEGNSPRPSPSDASPKPSSSAARSKAAGRSPARAGKKIRVSRSPRGSGRSSTSGSTADASPLP